MIQVELMQMTMQQFEGPEKKLEIILTAPDPSLRGNHGHRWNRVVHASGAEIISQITTEKLDAYLLSESSLFVWEDRLLMMTCGRTAPINALPEIFNIIKKDQISLLFYERKNLIYPHSQPSDFRKDVATLEGFFPGQTKRLGPAKGDHVHVFSAENVPMQQSGDVTLQLLMHDMDSTLIPFFQKEVVHTAKAADRETAIDRLFPHMKLDSHLFDPVGYSTNGIHNDRYFTIHVTPEPESSYVSFETNMIDTDYNALTHRITGLFQPAKFTLVLTTSNDAETIKLHHIIPKQVAGYDLTNEYHFKLDCDYTVTFINYAKLDKGTLL